MNAHILAVARNIGDQNAICVEGIDHADDTNFAWIAESFGNILTKIMHRHVLARIKHQMCGDTRKPKGTKVLFCLQHLLGHNMERPPNLPPFGDNQSLSLGEMIDIIFLRAPKSWQKEMEHQGFHPMEHKTNDVVKFMEHIQATKEFEQDKTKTKVMGNHPRNPPVQ